MEVPRVQRTGRVLGIAAKLYLGPLLSCVSTLCIRLFNVRATLETRYPTRDVTRRCRDMRRDMTPHDAGCSRVSSRRSSKSDFA